MDLFGADHTRLPPGAQLFASFVTAEREAELIGRIDAAPWRADLKRRTQHYGHRYDYGRRGLAEPLGRLPEWLGLLTEEIADWIGGTPDQVIVNEYLPGRGIASHIDRLDAFHGPVASLSLRSPCVMRFRSAGDEIVDVDLPPRSLLLLAGEARTSWSHGIAARRSDLVGGVRRARQRRVSLTFRRVRA